MSIISHNSYAKVINGLPGTGRLVQVWELHINASPHEDNSAVVKCFVADVNYAANTQTINRDAKGVVQDEGVSGWKDVPDDVQEALAELAPEGTHIIDGRGGHFVVGES